jgi:hypothetical protein
MRPLRIVAIIAGCLLLVPAFAMLLGGAALGLGHAFGRDADGFFETTIEQIQTGTVAVVSEELDLSSDPAGPSWIVDRLDTEVRLIVEDSSNAMFIGIAPRDDVDVYLAGVAHNEIAEIGDGLAPVYRYREGSSSVDPPGSQSFWVASAQGSTPLPLNWDPTEGTWTVVLMNSDASAGVLADVNVGVRAGLVLPAALILLGIGTLLTPITIGFIIFGTTSEEDLAPREDDGHLSLADIGHRLAPAVTEPQPVALEARLDPDLSHWKWMIKWLLAIPHFVVLLFLWFVFGLLTVVAGVSVLLFGRYPRAIFGFNVGVMRWSWRVSYYAASGGLGSDRYPPFSLKAQPDDLATLEVAYPGKLSRKLVLIKWWLLAIPHYLIVGILVGDLSWVTTDGTRVSGVSLLGLLCVFAGVSLLFTGTYPRSLFDLIIGLNRWMYRVLAYAALMTDSYPPFRLDQGGNEPPSDRRHPVASQAGSGIDPAVQHDRSHTPSRTT